MRLNEALALTLSDVDLANRLITVRNTKFFKARWVPTGPKLTSALADYARRRVRALPMPAGRDSAFFGTARSGTRWHCVVAEELFRRLRKRAGVCRDGNARNQPRIHDFRHTAAQHRLIARYRSGAARIAAIPVGESPTDRISPVTVVVISSSEKGDRLAGSLEVKALVAGRNPGQIRPEGRAT